MKISVVMPVYNGVWCITRALDSVLGQTHPPHEVIVCDDGSTDGTPDLVEDRYGDAVRVLRLPHRNASATRGVGMQQASGEWLAFIDADDTWRPDKLERQIAFIARHPEIRYVSSDGVFESADGVIRESWLADYFDPVEDTVGDLLPTLVERCWVLLSSMMVERRAYEEVGGLDPEIVYSHDFDLWLRLAARYPGALMADRLISYYSSPGALSRNFEARYRDNVDLMRRIAGGQLGTRRAIQRRAAERASSLAFDLSVICMSKGRAGEAKPYLRMAMQRGPWSRRIVAAGAFIMPGWGIDALGRLGFMKSQVTRVRESDAPMTPRAETLDAA